MFRNAVIVKRFVGPYLNLVKLYLIFDTIEFIVIKFTGPSPYVLSKSYVLEGTLVVLRINSLLKSRSRKWCSWNRRSRRFSSTRNIRSSDRTRETFSAIRPSLRNDRYCPPLFVTLRTNVIWLPIGIQSTDHEAHCCGLAPSCAHKERTRAPTLLSG